MTGVQTCALPISPKQVKTYKFSKFLTFGFIKSATFKIILFPTILSAVVILIFSGLENIPLLIATPLAVFLGGLLNGSAVNKPLRELSLELEKVKKLQLSDDLVIRTGDEIEQTYRSLTSAKESLREEITYIKGGLDDLYSFTEKFSTVATNMSEVSDLISQDRKSVV